MTLEPLNEDRTPEALTYRQALGAFATGVCVVTTEDERGTVAVTVNSFASVSLKPRLVVWSIDQGSERHGAFVRAERFAIHVLSADAGDTARRFARGDWRIRSGEFEAHLDGAVARFDCLAYQALPMGDHTMIVGQVEDFQVRPGAALTFHRGLYGRSGE